MSKLLKHMSDHVHMLVEIQPKICVSGFMRYLKERSAVIIYEQHNNWKYAYGIEAFGLAAIIV